MSEWINIEEEWAYWINPETFRMPRVKRGVLVDSVVLIKFREEDTDYVMVQTRYCHAASTGLEGLEDKRAASEILVDQMMTYMRAKGQWPPAVEIKKTFKNGNVELLFSPGDYDKFTLRFTPDKVGGDPMAFLNQLASFQEEEPVEPVRQTKAQWIVEPSKSGRARCRRCREKIANKALRMSLEVAGPGSHDEYRHYHLKCAADLVQTTKGLHGFKDLSKEHQAEVEQAISKS